MGGHLKPWQPGDPIGAGVTYLPTRELQQAYAAECRRQIIAADARAICAIPSIETRRARVAMYPAKWREELKQAIAEHWKARG